MDKLRIALTAVIVTTAISVPALATADTAVPTTTASQRDVALHGDEHYDCGPMGGAEDDCTWS